MGKQVKASQSSNRHLRYTWGDAVLTLLSFVILLYGVARLGRGPADEQARYQAIFWASSSLGLATAVGGWAFYVRRGRSRTEHLRPRERNRKLILALAPLLGGAGLLLERFGPVELQLTILGFAGGFMPPVMIGYALFHRRL